MKTDRTIIPAAPDARAVVVRTNTDGCRPTVETAIVHHQAIVAWQLRTWVGLNEEVAYPIFSWGYNDDFDYVFVVMTDGRLLCQSGDCNITGKVFECVKDAVVAAVADAALLREDHGALFTPETQEAA